MREIPAGRVTNYGAIARLTNIPAIVVGGILARIFDGEEAPWWRVVGVDGTIRTFARSAEIGREQTERLKAEGVEFDALGRVAMASASFEL